MSFNNESIWLGAGETWTSPVTDVVLEIVNVTSCVYDYVENGRKLTVTYDNRTIVYRGVETHSSRITESESSTGNYTEYQKEVSATNALSGVMVTTGYSYILASNFSYKIENLGIYDKSVLRNTGT
jgi:hypothetical protein